MSTLTKYELNDKIFCVTLDNASANVLFTQKLVREPSIPYSYFKQLEHNHVRCLAHVFHLAAQVLIQHFEKMPLDEDAPMEAFLRLEAMGNDIVDDAFIADLENMTLEDRPRDIAINPPPVIINQPIAFLRRFLFTIKMNSTKRVTLRGLQERYGVEQTKPVIDVKTRWNSTFDMLEWSIRNRQPLSDLMDESRFIFRFWDALEMLMEYLSIFDSVTSCVASQNSVLLSLALLSMERLIEKIELRIDCNDTPNNMREALIKSLSKLMKYQPMYQTKLFLIATLLHPRAKKPYFTKYLPNLTETAEAALYEIYEVYSNQTTNDTSETIPVFQSNLFDTMLDA